MRVSYSRNSNREYRIVAPSRSPGTEHSSNPEPVPGQSMMECANMKTHRRSDKDAYRLENVWATDKKLRSLAPRLHSLSASFHCLNLTHWHSVGGKRDLHIMPCSSVTASASSWKCSCECRLCTLAFHIEPKPEPLCPNICRSSQITHQTHSHQLLTLSRSELIHHGAGPLGNSSYVHSRPPRPPLSIGIRRPTLLSSRMP
jgi:hypothetical protein